MYKSAYCRIGTSENNSCGLRDTLLGSLLASCRQYKIVTNKTLSRHLELGSQLVLGRFNEQGCAGCGEFVLSNIVA